jgi:hypothetical protein
MSYSESLGNDSLEWPYQVDYGKENEITVDVLIIGGGVGMLCCYKRRKKGSKGCYS